MAHDDEQTTLAAAEGSDASQLQSHKEPLLPTSGKADAKQLISRAHPFLKKDRLEAGPNQFKVRLFGGYVSDIIDGVMVRAEGKQLKEWCEKFKWPSATRWRCAAFGEEHCHYFARELADKGQFYFEQWRRAGSPADFVYSEEQVFAHEEGSTFRYFMFTEDVRSTSFAAGLAVRRFRPEPMVYRAD